MGGAAKAAPRLKVYRTAVGFDDAYVAAPSKAAALRAWGAQTDLFAVGSAEIVTDPTLTAEPLAVPGQVVRRRRGTMDEHLAAAARQSRPKRPTRRAAASPQAAPERGDAARPDPRPLPRPRPSRERLTRAEQAVEAFAVETEALVAEIERREAALRDERRALLRERTRGRAALERKRDEARAGYEAALQRWRAED